MRAYDYRAARADGKVEHGTLQAANENDLQQVLADRHLELIACRPQRQSFMPRHHHKTLIAVDVAAWCRQMAYLLKAGVRLLDALRDTAADQTLRPRMRATINMVLTQVAQGAPLSVACATKPAAFDEIFCAILYAAEQGHDLTLGFQRLSDLYARQSDLHAHMRKALRYPLFLGLLAGGVVTFMMIGVVPALVAFLDSLHQDLPLATRLLIAFSDHFPVVVGGAAGVLASVAVAFQLLRHLSRRARLWLDGTWLRVPFFGALAGQRQRSLFFQSLSGLLQTRMRLLEALRHALPTLTNLSCRQAVEAAITQIETGRPLSAALLSWIEPAQSRMLTVGEASHDLGHAVEGVAVYYTACMRERVEAALKFIEPALTLCVGGVLAWIVLAVLGPIYGSLGHIQAGY